MVGGDTVTWAKVLLNYGTMGCSMRPTLSFRVLAYSAYGIWCSSNRQWSFDNASADESVDLRHGGMLHALVWSWVKLCCGIPVYAEYDGGVVDGG